MMNKLILTSSLLFFQTLFSPLSHAALFDDTEARKKIWDLQSQMQTQNEATQATLKVLDQRITAIEAVVKGPGLADMQNQIEQLKQEVARLKGEQELDSHNIDTTQQRQKDLYTDTDARLRKIEEATTAASVAAQTATAAPTVGADTQALEAADVLSQGAKHKEAFEAYDKFLKDFPNSSIVSDAQYGLGYSQFALKNYKAAIATQQKLLEVHPDSAKAPDAMLNMANSQIQLAQVNNAKKTLRDLISKYPSSAVIPSAQKRLKALEAIK
ncbi:MAG: tol-pal system protein YbgF [Methylophilaceae bacterium]|nr:tol-pal system protein YbgF [Methylophilaceae bacterium]